MISNNKQELDAFLDVTITRGDEDHNSSTRNLKSNVAALSWIIRRVGGMRSAYVHVLTFIWIKVEFYCPSPEPKAMQLCLTTPVSDGSLK